MEFSIKTIYTKEDIDGLLIAFASGQKHVRVSNKIVRIITTILAIPIWLVALFAFVAQVLTGDVRVILGGLPLNAFFVIMGYLIYSNGKIRLKSKASWKAYPHKGEELTYCFYVSEFTLEQKHSSSKIAYSGIIRLYEDAARFYLFDSPRTAHILPKRDFRESNTAEFGKFISASTGLTMEHT